MLVTVTSTVAMGGIVLYTYIKKQRFWDFIKWAISLLKTKLSTKSTESTDINNSYSTAEKTENTIDSGPCGIWEGGSMRSTQTKQDDK